MYPIIIKLLAMFFPVALGYMLKKWGFFGPTDYRILAKICINITLPCAVVASFAALESPDLSLLGIPVFSFVMNLIVAVYAWIFTKKTKDNRTRCMEMFCMEGFNMGNFLIPFAQQFMGATGVAVTALFDAGNSPMCTSGHYTFTTAVVPVNGDRMTLKSVVKRLLSSPPLLVYLVMILLMLLKIRIPEGISGICSLTGNANAFVSMFMMGLMFEIRFERRYMIQAATVLLKKYAFAVVMAIGSYYLLPFSLVIRQVLVLVAFAPIPSLAAIFTERVEGDVGLCSFITSCSFLISSAMITMLVMVMQVG